VVGRVEGSCCMVVVEFMVALVYRIIVVRHYCDEVVMR